MNALRKAAKTLKLPTIEQWKGRWRVRIGWRTSKSGKRQRAWHYLGEDETAAIAKATALRNEWRERKKKAKARGVKPYWNDDNLGPAFTYTPLAEQEKAIQEFHAHEDANYQMRIEGLGQNLILNAFDCYKEYINGQTQQNDNTRSKAINDAENALKNYMNIDLGEMEYHQVEKMRNDLKTRVNHSKLSKRTANNYWAAIAKFLKYCHLCKTIEYRHEDDVEDLFKKIYKDADGIDIAKYDASALATLVAGATDRQRLFIYLALNCGYTQVEIANLRYNEIIQEDGRWYIQRRRSKTIKQNDFEAIHILWPETADLLNKLKTVNKYGVALLSENGTPLRSAKPKKDIISDTYLVLQKRTKVSLPFKQFRKIGATAIQKLSSDEIRRLYKAGTITDGDKVYVREAWEKLHPVLDRWGDALRGDGVLK